METTLNANNGGLLAEILHDQELLKNDMNIDQCVQVANDNGIIPPFAKKWVYQDEFWESFIDRCDELGYRLQL